MAALDGRILIVEVGFFFFFLGGGGGGWSFLKIFCLQSWEGEMVQKASVDA